MSAARDLAPILEDLSIAPERLTTLGSGGPSSPRLAVLDRADARPGDLSPLESELGRDDAFLLWLRTDSEIDTKELAALRNRLWPHLHTFALYRATAAGIERRVLQGTTRIAEGGDLRGIVLAAHARGRVLSPAATVEKFDSNAASWNGEAGSPGYAHHRWMRRLVAHFADARQARRILDFGSGAGWVGIEAALVARNAILHAFDPSPEMIRLAEANARDSGVTHFEGRVGFGEDPPFPGGRRSCLRPGVQLGCRELLARLRGLARRSQPDGRCGRDARGGRFESKLTGNPPAPTLETPAAGARTQCPPARGGALRAGRTRLPLRGLGRLPTHLARARTDAPVGQSPGWRTRPAAAAGQPLRESPGPLVRFAGTGRLRQLDDAPTPGLTRPLRARPQCPTALLHRHRSTAASGAPGEPEVGSPATSAFPKSINAASRLRISWRGTIMSS